MKKSPFNYPELTIARLKAFVEVVHAGSIAKATNKDSTKQSQYSRQIKELENSLGIPLFNRNGKSMTPSFSGQELSGIVSAFSNALDELVSQHETAQRLIRIGAGNAVYQWLLLPIANELQKSLPLVSLEFRNLRGNEILEQLKTGQLDIGITSSQKESDTKQFTAHPIRSLRFALFYPKSEFKSPTLKKVLASKKLIGLSGSGSIWKRTAQLMKSHGVEPHLWMQFDSMPMIVNALRKTNGVAILPQAAGEDLNDSGYNAINSRELKSFEHNYSVLLNARVSEMRNSPTRAAETLARLLQ